MAEAEVTEKDLEIEEMVRPKLVQHGMFLVGQDTVRDKLMKSMCSVRVAYVVHSNSKDQLFPMWSEAIERKVHYYGRNFDNRDMSTLQLPICNMRQVIIVVGYLLAMGSLSVWGQEHVEVDAPPTETVFRLAVGTKHSPPFAFKNPDGQWTGISIELWKHLTDELNLEYELHERTLDEMLASLETGEFDAAVAAISVTADRHRRIEFCHPHFTTGLGIAVSAKNHASNWTLLRRVVSTRLLVIVGAMIGVVGVCGLLFWLFERKVNESMFGGRRRKGIGMGIWWSTIMLLGHKGVIPVSTLGRILATSAMLLSILLLSLLTGVIASVLTVQQLETGIGHPRDLTKVRVVTVAESTSADYLRRRRIAFQTRATADAVLQAVAEGAADAAVYDEALMKYMANREFAETIQVLPVTFNAQEYAIALPPNSTLRKPVNESLLRFRASDSWDELIFRYLGE